MFDLNQHLKDRHFDISKYNDVIVDDTHNIVTFMLWNLSGQMVGYQSYSPLLNKASGNHGKYLTHITDNKIGVWGLQVSQGSPSSVLYIVEGIFSACRLHNLGQNCIAVLANDPKKIKSFLFSLPHETIAICDGDKAGEKLGKYAAQSILLPKGKYIDEMPDEEIINLIMRK